MKNLLRLEELAQFLICLAALAMNDVPWWAYVLLIIGPDIGMLGYLVNARIGAITYNMLHHKGVAVVVLAVGLGISYISKEGLFSPAPNFILLAIILYGHSSMDRMLGYGLKYSDEFKHTHLGWIGKGGVQ